MKRFLVLMLAASMAAAHAFDYFSVGATFDPTYNYIPSTLYYNEDRIDTTTTNRLKYNTISAGVELGFGTIDRNIGKDDKPDPLPSDDYWFSHNAISFLYTSATSGVVNGYKFNSDITKPQGFKITYDFSYSKRAAITDDFEFHFGFVPYSFAFSHLWGEYNGIDYSTTNVELWRMGFNIGAQYKINPQGHIRLVAKPMITFLESKSITFEYDNTETTRSRIYPNKNMFQKITCPITVSYVSYRSKPV